VVNAAISQAITFQNLLDTMLVATTAIAGTNAFQVVRIRGVKVWAVPVLGNASTVSVEYSGLTAGAVGDSNIHSDTSMGIQPAFVNARPSARSLASTWQPNSSSAAFYLICPSGSVVDIEVSFRGGFGVALVAAQNPLVAATAGYTYLRGLDGLAIATTKFTPAYSLGNI
jgi:hypothetical protein